MTCTFSIKLIRSLAQKKHREQHRLFVVEGPKAISEFTKKWSPELHLFGEEANRVSFLQHPQAELALFSTNIFDDFVPRSSLKIMLDGVQDPGNLGTIIRVADWFGLDHIICSKDTADCLAPKVVQATMGSLARVKVEYCDLLTYLDSLPNSCPVYGTLLNGKNIYEQELTKNGIIIFGNEGKGISPEIQSRVGQALLIPGAGTAESLNVAVATAITLSEFIRR